MKFFQVKTVEETFQSIDKYIRPTGKTERKSLWEARGFVLAENVIVKEDVPGFRRSSVDGYAVKAADTFGASEGLPAFLNIAGEVRMGEHVTTVLQQGQAIYVPTGGMLPPGSDAMVMIEFCEDTSSLLNVFKQAAPNENVIAQGEDMRTGEVLLKKGTKLRAQEFGALASQGIVEVLVMKKPVIGYLSSGDEIVPFETKSINMGEIRDMNALTIGALTEEWGCEFRYGGIVPDDEDELRSRAEELLGEVDCLVLSGGSSVGTKDYSIHVIEGLGKPGVFVHGISVKPGKPTILASANGKPVIGLPGHPASALIIYQLFGKEILNRLEDSVSLAGSQIYAQATKKIPSAAGRTDYVRVRLSRQGEKWQAEPIFGKSGLISTLVESDGILEIPSRKEGINKDEVVAVTLFR